MRILIVEDDAASQAWLCRLLEQAYKDVHCALATSVRDARRYLSQEEWALVLVDLALPDGSGIDLLQDIQQQHAALPAIVTTIFDDDDNVFRALAAGAQGYLLKSQPEESLVQHLRMMADGQPPMSAPIARRLLNYFQQPENTSVSPSPVTLTPREVDVLQAIGKGLRTREVAARLGLTEQTVATYIRDLYCKLNIRSRAQAALEAARRGLIQG